MNVMVDGDTYHPNDNSHYPVESEPNGLLSLQSNGRLPQGLQGFGRSCLKRESGGAKSCWFKRLAGLANKTHLKIKILITILLLERAP